MDNKRPLIILTGPTAVGKTELSIALARALNGEIICADSMQVYKHMDIGTAKITKEEMQGVSHWLVDEYEPDEEFNVVVFQKKAKYYIEKIYERGHVPILVGGTGFYLQAVLYDIDFKENEENSAIREKYQSFAESNGAHALHEKLRLVDEKSAENIHENNIKRVIRALEYYELTGEKISEHNKHERTKSSPYNYRYFVLDDLRENLYRRIDKRVDKMMEDGLLDEVKNLRALGYNKNMVSMNGLGYKEILEYLDGNCTLEEAVYIIKRDTRHFAKRQLTWFRREKDVIYVNKNEFNYDNDKILQYILDKIEL